MLDGIEEDVQQFGTRGMEWIRTEIVDSRKVKTTIKIALVTAAATAVSPGCNQISRAAPLMARSAEKYKRGKAESPRCEQHTNRSKARNQ